MTATPNQSVDPTRAAGAAASRRPRVLGPPEGAEGGDHAAPAPVSAPTAGVAAASISAVDGGPDAFDRSPQPSGTAAAERLRAAYEAEEGWRRFAGRDERPAGAIRPDGAASGAGASGFLGESQREAFAAIGRALADRRVCVALTGPAGAGKTALLEAVLAAMPGVASRVFRIDTPAAVDEAQAEQILRVGLGSRRGLEWAAARPARDAPPGAAGTGAESHSSTAPTEGGTPGASSAVAPAGRGGSRGDAPGAGRSGRGPGGDGRAPVGNALFVVDDAHEASPLLLRCLARVAAERRDGRRSAQILLVGRPELWDRLRQDAFAPLAQRLVLRFDLKPWTETDARAYIAHLLDRPRRVEGQVLAPDAEQEVLHRARARPDRIGALVGAALSRVDLRTRSPITRDDVLAVARTRGDDARGDGTRTDDLRTGTGPRMDRDDRSRDARPGGVRTPPPPRPAAFARPPFGARGAAVTAAVVLAVVGAGVAGVSLFRRAAPPHATSAPGQTVLAPTPDGSADRRTAEGASASSAVDRAGPARDPVAPTLSNRGDEIGAGGGAATSGGAVSSAASSPPPGSTPPGRLEDAAVSGGPGEPSSAPTGIVPTGGDPAPKDERTAAVGPTDAPPGPEQPAAPDGEGVSRVEGTAPAGAGETSQTATQPPAARPHDPAEAPSSPLSPTVLAALMRRGDEMLAGGDPAGARRFYERAAASGSAPGMRGMARTFDPAVIGRDGGADPASAAAWYARAAALGDATAAARLGQIERTR